MKVGDLIQRASVRTLTPFHSATFTVGQIGRIVLCNHCLPVSSLSIDTQDEALAQEMQPGTVGKSLADQFESRYLPALLLDVLAETSRRAA
jgi:hypothetical protein